MRPGARHCRQDGAAGADEFVHHDGVLRGKRCERTGNGVGVDRPGAEFGAADRRSDQGLFGRARHVLQDFQREQNVFVRLRQGEKGAFRRRQYAGLAGIGEKRYRRGAAQQDEMIEVRQEGHCGIDRIGNGFDRDQASSAPHAGHRIARQKTGAGPGRNTPGHIQADAPKRRPAQDQANPHAACPAEFGGGGDDVFRNATRCRDGGDGGRTRCLFPGRVGRQDQRSDTAGKCRLAATMAAAASCATAAAVAEVLSQWE